MANPIGTRPIPWLADRDPKRQQFFEEVKHKLDNIEIGQPTPPQSGVIEKATSLVGQGVAGGPILAYRVVTTNNDGQLIYADSSTPDHSDQVLGLALNSSAPGGIVEYIDSGDAENPGWNWTPGAPLFLGASGAITQNPNVGVFQIQIGYAKTATKVNVRIGFAIHR